MESFFDWLDDRTNYRAARKHLLEEPLPPGTGWWFVTGSILLFLLGVQLLTGVVLSMYYIPSSESAYDSVRFIMVEFEADDALAAAATAAARDARVERVVICTPDKDLAQCVRGTRIVQMDRRRRIVRDEAGVIEKFGVPPASIADYLALVGDSADGYPGLPGWGARSAAAVLARFGCLESIPRDSREWKGVNVAKPAALAYTLERQRDLALLFRELATLRVDIPLFESVDELQWNGMIEVARLRGYGLLDAEIA